MKITKLSSILLAFFLVSFIGLQNANAKKTSTEKNDIRVSISDAFTLTMINSFQDTFVSSLGNFIEGKKKVYESKSPTYGMLHISYQRSLNNKLKVGVDFSYAKFEYKSENTREVSYTGHYLAIAPQFEFSYIRRNFFELYANASVGLNKLFCTIDKETVSNHGTTFQVNPIGIRVGKKLAGFLEAGFGYSGYVNLGISYKF